MKRALSIVAWREWSIINRDGTRIYFNHSVSEDRIKACYVETEEILDGTLSLSLYRWTAVWSGSDTVIGGMLSYGTICA